MDFKKIIESSRGDFEKLVAGIPGYKGYKEKELRRESDLQLRRQIVRELEEQQRKLVDHQLGLVSAGLIQYTDDLERAIMKLQTLRDRIRTATYGYRGLFDAVKVKEDELDALYAFDVDLLAGVPEIEAGIDKVGQAVADQAEIAPAIAELVGIVRKYNELFSRREEALLQSEPSV